MDTISNNFEILGMKVYEASLSQYLGDVDTIYTPDQYHLGRYSPVYSRIRNPEPPTLSFKIQRHLYDILYHYAYKPIPIFNLGKTVICSHCGFEAKPGLITCHRCGSIMRTDIEQSKYTKAGTMCINQVSYKSIAELINEDDGLVEVEITILPEGDTFDFRTSWNTLNCDGEWICAYCHCVNYSNDVDCRFCSSGRLPFSNLKELPSNCLYCGKPLRGATICEMCSSAKNGYAVWPAIYKM